MTWIAAISVILLLLKLLIPSKKSIVDLRAPLFLITTLIMGPGIVVNAILKNNWGRPRPKHIEEFGGVDPFIGIWNPTDICPTNCSFVSGEASMAIWLFAVVFLLPRFWKWPAAIFIAILCLVFSANRVAFGGHFLSDTLLSWGITMLVILTTYFLLYRWTPKWAQPEALDSSFSKAGFWLHKKGAIVGTRIAEAFKGFIAKFR
nr:phosphatase PAP2 family protein [Pseudovibrio flavus]